MSETTDRLESLLIVAVLVFAGFVAILTGGANAAGTADGSVDAPASTITDVPTVNALPSTDEIPYWKIDPELRTVAAAGSKGWSLVDIYTVRNSELAPVLTKYGARTTVDLSQEGREIRALTPRMGATSFRPTGDDGLPLLQRVLVPNAALAEIASLPGVFSISRPLNPSLDVAPRLQTPVVDDVGDPVQALRDSGIRPTNYPSVVEHGSLEVQNTLGIDGTDINIAIVDTTVDFGHPNLVGQWAVYEDPASPYFGWPIVLDRSSALTNLELWTTASDFDRFPYPFFSSFGTANLNFFSDTHYSISDGDDGATDGFLTYRQGLGGYVVRNDPGGISGKLNTARMNRAYFIGSPIPIASASGTYRLGVLHDDYLTQVYGRPSLDYLFGAPDIVQTSVGSGVLSVTWRIAGRTSVVAGDVVGARDVDFGIFYDPLCVGLPLGYDVTSAIHGRADAPSTGSNIESFTLNPAGATPVPSGCYYLHVAGFDVDTVPASTYDLTVTTATATSTTVTTTPNLPVTSYPYTDQLGRVGLLLADSTTSGVYDTVYADLNFDGDFTDETPATMSSPLLIRDDDGDGLADISGGIVYFISPPETAVTGEVVTPFYDARNKTTKAQLANGNLVADVYDFFNLDLPTLSLGSLYWPSAGEDVYEVLIGAAAGNEKGTSQFLTAGDNILSFAPVDTAALLANYNLSHVYAVTRYDATGVECPLGCVLEEGLDYEIDMNTGNISWLHNFAIDDFIDIIYEFRTWRVDFRTGEIIFLANATAGSTITASYSVGMPVPYADVLADRHGLDLFVPAGGDLVGVYGAGDRQTHGTGTASTAAGVSTDTMDCGFSGPGDCDTWGQAPGAKIISIDIFKPNAFGFDAWYFAVEGADGIPGTGDEANITSNSWGWVDLPESGWEDWSRFKYFLNTVYAPDVVFVQSSGNDGQGYATESGPTGPNSIQAGAAISADIYWLLGFTGGEQFTFPSGTGLLGPGPYGDVADFSSRGPNALGQPGPDILGIGHGGVAGIPVNEFFSGQDAWDLFGGTSQAAPNVAGIIALIMEGYASTHGGQMPSGALVRSILKTTAQDVHRETVSQGSGFANAVRAVRAAMNIEGVTADVHEWIPGGYGGKPRDMYLNFVRSGATDSRTITLTNRGATAETVTLSDEIYTRSGTFSFEWAHTNVASNFWVLKKTGVYRSHGNGFPGDGLEQAADLTALWDNADFMKVWTYSDPNIGKQDSALILYDWYDIDNDGIWDRLTEESLIGPLVFQGDFSGSRINSKAIYSPKDRIHTGLGVRQTFFSSDGTPIPTTLYVEFYERADWAWVSLTPTSVNIPAGGTATVTASITVPAGTGPGSYDGGIYYTDGSNTSTIQVLVNVPATSLPVSFGGGTVRGSLYEPNAFATGQVNPVGGDGRWIWVDTTALPAGNRKMLYNLGWANASSDAEVLVFAPVTDPDGEYDGRNNTLFGPSTFALLDSTKRDPAARDTVETGWEFLATDVQPGVFFMKVQSLRTTVPHEAMQGNLGIMTTSSDDMRLSTNDAKGSLPVTISSQVPLRSAFAVDPTGALVLEPVSTKVQGRTVTSYPFTGGAYIDYLFGAPNKTRTDVAANTYSATWTLAFGGGAADVDMGVFYDADCNGVYTAANDVIGFIEGSTFNKPETATYEVLDADDNQLPLPVGCYWVHAAGVDVTGVGTYDLTFDAEMPVRQGIGIAATQAESSSFLDLPVDSFPFPGGSFIDYLFNAPNRFKTEVPTGTIVASWVMTFHSGADDVDYGLFYDSNCDGTYTVADDAAGTVAGTGANPERITLSFPAPGCYWLHAAGFTVAGGGGLYDLAFSLTKIGVSAFVPDNIPTATVPAETTTSFDIAWSLPSGTAEFVTTDFIFVSPGNAPFALAQQIALTFSYDLTPPTLDAQLPAPSSIVSDPFAGIFAQFGDTQPGSIARNGEIDQSTLGISLDGTDVTSLATVSAPHGTNVGYSQGIILFTPTQPMRDGVHTVTVQGGDFAGNILTVSWTFTVDTTAPAITILSPTAGLATRADSVTVLGQTESGVSVTVAGQAVAVDASGQFSATVSLVENATNSFDVIAVDAIGNTASTTVTVVHDRDAPGISLLRSSVGLLTNKDLTVVAGVVDEAASLTVGGIPATVHADGSFSVPVPLVEGTNTIQIVATDAAGNSASSTLTVARDSTPPTLTMADLPTETSSPTVTVSGTVESGISFVTVNGQPVPVTGGAYSTDVALSFGANVIFVEATDSAGNRAITSAAVSYVPTGVTTASIGLILLPVLAIIALLVGLAIGGMRGGRPPKEEKLEDKEAVPPAEEELPPEGGEL